VCAHIRARRQQLSGAVVEITRVRDCGDGSFKVDFHEGSPIKLNVLATYTLCDGRIATILEVGLLLMVASNSH
jgi:hypothetical protein